jgi:hypothetical protein
MYVHYINPITIGCFFFVFFWIAQSLSEIVKELKRKKDETN